MYQSGLLNRPKLDYVQNFHLRLKFSIHLFTWDLWGLTMNLNLSMAMVITVREDMKAATLGMVRVILEGARRLYIICIKVFE